MDEGCAFTDLLTININKIATLKIINLFMPIPLRQIKR